MVILIKEIFFTAFLGMLGWAVLVILGHGVQWLQLAIKLKRFDHEKLKHKEALLEKALIDVNKAKETYLKLIEAEESCGPEGGITKH